MIQPLRSPRDERGSEAGPAPLHLLIYLPALLCVLWLAPALTGQEETEQEETKKKVPSRVLAELKEGLESPARDEGHREKWERYSRVIREARGYLLEYEGAENLYKLRHVLLMALQSRINLEADAKTYRMLLETARKIMESGAPRNVKLEADLVLLREKIRSSEEDATPAWRLLLDFVGRYEGSDVLGKALLYAAMSAESEARRAVLNIVQQELRDRRAFWDVPMATGFLRRRTEANLSGRTLNTVTETLEGKPFRAPADVLGKVTILHFWAGRAPQSLEGIERLKKFYGKHKQHVRVVGVGMDSERSVMQRAIAQHELPWTQTFSGQGPNDRTALSYGVFGLPSVIYLDPLGRCRRLKGLGGHYGRKPSTALENGYGEVVRKATREIRRYETLNDVVKHFRSGSFLDRMTGEKFSSREARKLYEDYRGTIKEMSLAPEDRVETRENIRNFMEAYEGSPSEPAAVILGGLLSVQSGRDAMMQEIGKRLAEHHAEVPQARSVLRYVLDRHVEVGREFKTKLKRENGNSLELPEALDGKVGVVCFWDAESMKEFEELPDEPKVDRRRRYPYTGLDPKEHEDLEVIGVHVGNPGEEAKKMMEDRSGWIHTRIADPESHPLLKRLDLYEYPSIWIVGRDGRVVADDMQSAKNRSPILSAALHQPAPSRVRARVAGPWRVLGPFDQQKIDGLPESGYSEPPNWVKTDAAQRSWMVTSWMEVPWHREELNKRFRHASFPIVRGERELDFDATYDDGTGEQVGWRTTEVDRSGFVNLDTLFDDHRPLPYAYAATYVHSSTGGTYRGTFTSTDTGVLRVNGVETVRGTGQDRRIRKTEVWAVGQRVKGGWKKRSRYSKMPMRRRRLRRNSFEVHLRKGWNEITLKTWDVWNDWRFQLRFHDPDRTLRYAAAPSNETGAHSGSLSKWEPPAEDETPGRLLRMLDGPDADTILAAANALGELPDAKTVIRRMRSPPKIDVRRLLIARSGGAGVRRRGANQPIDTLKLLHAVHALSLWTPSESLRKKYPDRSNAAIALKALKPKNLYEKLVKGLKNTEGQGKRPFVKALGMLGDRRAVPVLMKELRKEVERNPELKYVPSNRTVLLREALCRALGRLGDPKAAKAVLPILKDKREGFRLVALKALVRIGNESTLPRVIQELKNADGFDYGDQKVYEMGFIDHPEAVKWLKNETRGHFDTWPPDGTVEALGHSVKRDPLKAVTRIRSLSRHGGKRVLDELLVFLRHEKMRVRMHAMNALGRIGSEKAVPALIDELQDPGSKELRHYAVRALERIGDARATDPVASLLTDNSFALRSLAARALRVIDEDGNAVHELIEALDDPHWLVRVNAAETLAAIDAKQAIDPLITLLKDPNSSVRGAAAGALGELKARKAQESLIELLTDWQAGPDAAAALNQFGWTPDDPAKKVYLHVAAREGVWLLEHWKTTREVLYEDLKKDGKSAVNAALALVAVGKDESVSELTSFLDKTDHTAVTAAFLTSGKNELIQRAMKWANANERDIERKRQAATVVWGAWQ